MEKLTMKTEVNVLLKSDTDPNDYNNLCRGCRKLQKCARERTECNLIRAIKRLAEYEDTGLLPYQIREIDRLYAELSREVWKYRTAGGPAVTGEEKIQIKNLVHDLKIQKEFADAVIEGKKTFEIRINDRGYAEGDCIKFQAIDAGEAIYHPINDKTYQITYVISGWGLEPGYAVLGIKEIKISK